MRSHPFRLLAFILALAPLLPGNLQSAEPLSKKLSLDFYRDVPSRNLKGLATRSDGRLVTGPTFTDLDGARLADLLWCLEPSGKGSWLIGTGPDGQIFEATLDVEKNSFTTRELVRVGEPQVFALKRLPDGSILAGTSPHGALLLVREGAVAARVALPVDSIFEIVLLAPDTALVATGNPGRIYRVDLAKFSAAGVDADKIADEAALTAKGISLFGEVRDRNVRRLALLGDRVIAGSSPRGNVYAFARDGGAPQLLLENREAEVSALLPQPDGDLYAAIVFADADGDTRISRATTKASSNSETTLPPPATTERFSGRSAVVFLPKNGFPETIVSRSGLAFYALARHGDFLIIAGGEQGDVLGYDVKARRSLSFAGSVSTQLNQIAAIPGSPDRFLALSNNAPGLALLDFDSDGVREFETRRFDFGVPSSLGALRFEVLRGVDPARLVVEFRTSEAADDAEGWSAWTPATRREDGWIASSARGRYVKFRCRFSADTDLLIDRASLFYLPQNRRPSLTEVRFLPPGFALIPAGESPPSPTTTLGQLIGSERDEKRKNPLLNSAVVPEPGNQVVVWTVNDPDGDEVACTFSIQREGADEWTDIAVDSRDGYVQFDTSHLDDGIYFARLIATEQAPRSVDDRLSATFPVDEFIVDRTPPAVVEATAARENDALAVTVRGRDALSLLDGAGFIFNNGYAEEVSQPLDGIRDSKAETFVLRAPLAKTLGATSLEVLLVDAAGNRTALRLPVPAK